MAEILRDRGLKEKENHNKEIHNNKHKNKRGSRKHKAKYINIFSSNAAQLKGKIDSFKNALKENNASIFTLQETHFPQKGRFQVQNFEIFEAIRNKEKGGSAIGVHKALNPCLIKEYSDEFELVVVEIQAANKEIRIITGYGPQECWPIATRMPFFLALEEEIMKSQLAGKSTIIQLDANSKLGPDLVPGDKHEQSANGSLLAGIIARHSLIIGNSLNKCKGLITRRKATKDKVEESTIDFVIFSADMLEHVDAITVDEKRENVLTKLTKTKKGVKKIESDHNPIISKLAINWNMKSKINRLELFNLKNKTCQEMFYHETSSEINKKELSSIFDEKEDLNLLAERFMKKLDKVVHKCFKKIRITDKKDEEKEKLLKKWNKLKAKDDIESKMETKRLEKDLADKYAEEYFKKIKDRTEGTSCEDGGLHPGSLWNLKKELFPQSRDPPTAMVDPENGNLVTNEEKIQKLALKTYTKRLENKPIKKGLENIQDAKEKLCDKLLKVAAANKTPPWQLQDLEKVLKFLKKNKSRDAHGYCNELFQNKVAGDDLKLALLKLMNRIKSDQVFPKCMELCNITSIWKRKGPRNDYDSYRGIFRVTIFRSILDRLIYNDEYSNLDENLTDCNVGGRKVRNIRDNIFVINAILNSIRKGKENEVDFQVYDVKNCFDNLWLHEVINSLYEAGLDNDKLPLLFLENRNAQVAVKTSGVLSTRANIHNIIMQGSVWGTICCVVLMDKLGKICYQNPELLYYYKGLVAPLQMVDDILVIQKCSTKSQRMNGAINTFIELEKLKLSSSKCKNVHVSKTNKECHTLKVHGIPMKQSDQETYLGDAIHKSGLLRYTLAARVSKGYGAVTSILSIVKEIPLAHWRVEAGLRLREALLINGILFNSEAWQGVTDEDIKTFEKVDEALIRGILGAHSKIPLESLYLETGSMPLRFVIRSRRLCYLKTILDRDPEELIKEIYEAQKVDPTTGDFAQLIQNDASEISLDISNENEIKMMKMEMYKTKVKIKVRKAALEYLLKIKATHSKLKNLHYNKLEIADYMKSPLFDHESVQLLLALRTRTVRGVKTDFRGMFNDVNCPLGCAHTDTIPNILICPAILAQFQTTDVVKETVKYDDIYSIDVVKQKQITALYNKHLEIREMMKDSSPAAMIAGPMH